MLDGTAKTSLPTGWSSLSSHRGLLGSAHGEWTAYLADEQACPGGKRTDLPLQQQARVMVCLVNHARTKRGLASLATLAALNASSSAKAERIARCREFAHTPCGHRPDADARAAGYTGPFGENLYIATGPYRTPRAALDSWLNSPAHRANLFRPEWRTQGIALKTLERFGPYRHVALWVNEFGTNQARR